MTHDHKGLTDKDFQLAKKIEEVVQWQPGLEGGAIEGTPQEDLRFAYVKYDNPRAEALADCPAEAGGYGPTPERAGR